MHRFQKKRKQAQDIVHLVLCFYYIKGCDKGGKS
jgi:hypothetical protein